ncbi:hypothetical protein [Aliarcobacter cryaerophilus]|uniref:hypothetical protein n=1 Tax=Aliarcobacter cryaerophilus TaxID=28198 RepID=UPI0011DFCCD5|nr:hypothetical protein [Aliarcobacter cryaerophilus]
MKSKFRLIFIIFISIFIQNLMADEYAYRVKKGTLPINPNITLEQAFKNYKNFEGTEWVSLEDNGVIAIQAISKLTQQYLFNNATDFWTSELDVYFMVQFVLLDNMIIPNGIALIYEDKKTGDLIQQKTTHDYSLNLKDVADIVYDIYYNQSLSHIYN